MLGESVSSLGSQMTFLALPWFVLITTGSAARMALVLAVELTPVALLGIPSGGVIARYGARRTMMVADLCRAPVLAAVPLLHSLGVTRLLAPARARGARRGLHRAVVRRAAARAAGARGRERDGGRAGERRLRGRSASHGAARPDHRRAPDLGLRGTRRALRRRGVVPVRVRDALALRAAAAAEACDDRESRRARRRALHPTRSAARGRGRHVAPDQHVLADARGVAARPRVRRLRRQLSRRGRLLRCVRARCSRGIRVRGASRADDTSRFGSAPSRSPR